MPGPILKFAVAIMTMATVSWVFVEMRGRKRVFDDPMKLPSLDVGLVLGCAPLLSDGRPNRFFNARMDTAAAAFQAGRCRVLVVSGSYGLVVDEAGAMKAALVERGVPAEVRRQLGDDFHEVLLLGAAGTTIICAHLPPALLALAPPPDYRDRGAQTTLACTTGGSTCKRAAKVAGPFTSTSGVQARNA